MDLPTWDTPFEREALFHALTAEYLKQEGVWFLDTSALAPGGTLYSSGQPGAPDFLIVCAGRTIALELKSKRGKLTRPQEHARAKAEAAGVNYHVVRTLAEIRDATRFA